MLQSVVLLGLLAETAFASYAQNINFRSPSHVHPNLGISIPKVAKRNVEPHGSIDAASLSFTHGVASGDPYPNSVILWTRCAPEVDNVDDDTPVEGTAGLYNNVPIQDGHATPLSKSPVCLNYKVSKDEDFKKIADKGTVFTSSDVDYTVKVEASHLQPFQTYYYQFTVCDSDKSSPVGRTKTTPEAGDPVEDGVGIAVFSCSHFANGYFNAYGNAARKDDVDFVVHLGDYIYESDGDGSAINRTQYPEKYIFSLYDYRKRHATHKTDLDLLQNQQNFPWIPVWDDHEVSDNTYRDGSSKLFNTEESFLETGEGISVDQRKMNAVRAYFEWMPIRQVDMDDGLRIWRNFKIGSLVDLLMLDTRQYDRSITDIYTNTDYIHTISDDAGRSMMGPRQENWFYHNLIDSNERGASWRIIGSQMIFGHIQQTADDPNPYNYDAWDGYMANKNRTLQTLYDNNIGNNIFIAGDTHANWVSDVIWHGVHEYDDVTGNGSIGAEFGGTAVTSSGQMGDSKDLEESQAKSKDLVDMNLELKWSEVYYRGYFELHLTPDVVEANFFGVPDWSIRSPQEVPLANFTVFAGENRLSRTDGVPSKDGEAVENGYLKNGEVKQLNLQVDTETGEWSEIEW
ncbi:hypothetical protein FQN54_008563 [Arachnomyces sp. PD_36]|nr:hypothetical protein FQN54_008563 [Arachnomyces sp. PD_36]